jgi:hypothetical protein
MPDPPMSAITKRWSVRVNRGVERTCIALLALDTRRGAVARRLIAFTDKPTVS